MNANRTGPSIQRKIKLRERKRVNYAETEDVYDDIEKIQALVDSSVENLKTSDDSTSNTSEEDNENDALEALVQLIRVAEKSATQAENQKVVEYYKRIIQYMYSAHLLHSYFQPQFTYYNYPPNF